MIEYFPFVLSPSKYSEGFFSNPLRDRADFKLPTGRQRMNNDTELKAKYDGDDTLISL
jgi:hypothetical protein